MHHTGGPAGALRFGGLHLRYRCNRRCRLRSRGGTRSGRSPCGHRSAAPIDQADIGSAHRFLPPRLRRRFGSPSAPASRDTANKRRTTAACPSSFLPRGNTKPARTDTPTRKPAAKGRCLVARRTVWPDTGAGCGGLYPEDARSRSCDDLAADMEGLRPGARRRPLPAGGHLIRRRDAARLQRASGLVQRAPPADTGRVQNEHSNRRRLRQCL